MLVTTNITNTEYDLNRFPDSDAIYAFCRANKLDGLELLPFGENALGIIPAGCVIGVHLSYFPCWVDFWNGNERGVREEFGDMQTARARFGGSRDEIVRMYRTQLDWAEMIGAKYVVFHVSDVSLRETVTYQFIHTDEEVAFTSLDLIRRILEGKSYRFAFLVENLWWPGFTFTRPEITRMLIDGIPCENKGIMLDTGHLMHMNLDIASEEEGVAFMLDALRLHGDTTNYVRGLHLNQSISGETVKRMIANPPTLKGTYDERMGQAYEHVLAIDGHRPFASRSAQCLINAVHPEFLTYEFITSDNEQHAEFIRTQNAALDR